jgi:hypothetical protein
MKNEWEKGNFHPSMPSRPSHQPHQHHQQQQHQQPQHQQPQAQQQLLPQPPNPQVCAKGAAINKAIGSIPQTRKFWAVVKSLKV